MGQFLGSTNNATIPDFVTFDGVSTPAAFENNVNSALFTWHRQRDRGSPPLRTFRFEPKAMKRTNHAHKEIVMFKLSSPRDPTEEEIDAIMKSFEKMGINFISWNESFWERRPEWLFGYVPCEKVDPGDPGNF